MINRSLSTVRVGALLLAVHAFFSSSSQAAELQTCNRMCEFSFDSKKAYADPFNDVDVDVIFSSGDQSWRVPTFWRGGSRWTVRFAPPAAGEYQYRLESTDALNPDLNGHDGRVRIAPYAGPNVLLKRGAFRVSRNGRYFEQADGTPFYWLGDTWYTGFSDRLSWEGFQQLTADRKAKGFTLIELAVMTAHEELEPVDPGFANEGGAVWDAQFQRINPAFFDYADRRVQHLIDAELAPAIVGAWRRHLGHMSVAKLKQHWRYLIARYGAYPVFWIGGGEVYDPPAAERRQGIPYGSTYYDLTAPGWTEVVRYIRAIDPYHHPLTAHEIDPPFDTPLQDESLKDFELFQAGHRGWPSLATAVAQLNMHYARTAVSKPLIIGEIGWETLTVENFEGYQRMAFWLTMLNGAAGYTYGNAMTGESYSVDKPFHRFKFSAMTWEEGMRLPGSYQAGLGAQLLKQYPWQHIAPHPEWVTPRGTTLLEPRAQISGFDIDLIAAISVDNPPPDEQLPLGEWRNRRGTFRLPYAAGIPGKLRLIYIPPRTFSSMPKAPTVLKLEKDVRYRAYYWEPSLGIKFDLGTVQRPTPAALLFKDAFGAKSPAWTDHGAKSVKRQGVLVSNGALLTVATGIEQANAVAAVNVRGDSDAALVLRFHDVKNFIAARYSPKQKAIYVFERRDGTDGPPLGLTEVADIGPGFRLSAEVRDGAAVVSITDGQHSFTSPIVDVENVSAGGIGLLHQDDGATQSFDDFEVRMSPPIDTDEPLQKKLYDARGNYRGELSGPGWDDFGRNKHLLLDAYRPERLPFPQDFVLVLEAQPPISH